MTDSDYLLNLPVPARPHLSGALSALTKLALTAQELTTAAEEVDSKGANDTSAYVVSQERVNGDTSKEIEHDFFATAERRKKAEDADAAELAASKSVFENYRPVFMLYKRAADEKDHPFTVAVDLDGTLAKQEKPFDPKTIGPIRERAKHWMDAFHEAGARLIIFTVRGDEKLVKKWLKENDVPYDYINENPDQPPDSSGKVFADVYWDDRAYNAEDLDEYGPVILERINGEEEEGKPEDGPIIVIEQTKFRLVMHPESSPVAEAS